MTKLLLAGVLLAMGLATAKASPPFFDPPLNCVAVVYLDSLFGAVPIETSFANVAWSEANTLDTGDVIEVRIIHDNGNPNGPGQTIFTGFPSYAAFNKGENLLVRRINPSPPSPLARERLFRRADGSQSPPTTLADGRAAHAANNAAVEFTSIPTSPNADYVDAQAAAALVDVGLCTPDPDP